MSTQGDKLRDELRAILAEDAHNTERLCARLDELATETGIGPYVALLMILTRKTFAEDDAYAHWNAIVQRQQQMSAALGREIGVRVAALDYFVNENRQLVQPALIDVEMLEQVSSASALDPLTGLASERSFRSALANELRRARRYELPATVAVFDLDDFAEINDRLGALVADRLLREAAMLFANKVRDIDQTARCGSDELVLLLPETDRNGGLLVAERCRQAIEEFFAKKSQGRSEIGLTLSGGVAAYPQDARTPELLLRCAAQALYQAKAAGKNTVELYQRERRHYLRFDLEPGLFEVEVLSPTSGQRLPLLNLSREGLLFASPEAIEVGERIELRVAAAPGPNLGGHVVRLEELADCGDALAGGDRYEIGVVFDLSGAPAREALLEFLNSARAARGDGTR